MARRFDGGDWKCRIWCQSTAESWARFSNKTAQIIAKASTSLPLSVSDMLTHMRLPYFPYGGPSLWRDTLLTMWCACSRWEGWAARVSWAHSSLPPRTASRSSSCRAQSRHQHTDKLMASWLGAHAENGVPSPQISHLRFSTFTTGQTLHRLQPTSIMCMRCWYCLALPCFSFTHFMHSWI